MYGGHIWLGTLSAYLCRNFSNPNSIYRKSTLLFWSWITFRVKEKKIKPTLGWNYRKNKVSDLKLVFSVLINNSSHASENLKIHRICSSFAWDQWPRINLVAGYPQLPHHVCGVGWSQDLWIPILLEQSPDQQHSRWIRCFFTATLAPAIIFCGSALSPFVHHTTEEINEQRKTMQVSLFYILTKPSKPDLASTAKMSPPLSGELSQIRYRTKQLG